MRQLKRSHDSLFGPFLPALARVLQVQPAQVDEELEFAKLRLRQEIITAAFSNDAGARILLDSDVQVLRALDALPDAKRLADAARNGGVWQG